MRVFNATGGYLNRYRKVLHEYLYEGVFDIQTPDFYLGSCIFNDNKTCKLNEARWGLLVIGAQHLPESMNCPIS